MHIYTYIYIYIHTQNDAVSHEELALVVNENNRLRGELEAALAGNATGTSPKENSDADDDTLRADVARLTLELAATVNKVRSLWAYARFILCVNVQRGHTVHMVDFALYYSLFVFFQALRLYSIDACAVRHI